MYFECIVRSSFIFIGTRILTFPVFIRGVVALLVRLNYLVPSMYVPNSNFLQRKRSPLRCKDVVTLSKSEGGPHFWALFPGKDWRPEVLFTLIWPKNS